MRAYTSPLIKKPKTNQAFRKRMVFIENRWERRL